MLDNFRTGLKHTVEAYEGAISGKVIQGSYGQPVVYRKEYTVPWIIQGQPRAAAMAVVGQVFKDILLITL